MSPTLIVPVTYKSLVILTSLDGTTISPYTVARNSKSLLLSVVVIILFSILIFSNCDAAVTVRFPVIPKLPVKLILPVCVTLPVCVMLPCKSTLLKVVVP